MTDLEINKALALAIGWQRVMIIDNMVHVFTNGYARVFDYRDWAVAGPIAERYGCFPSRYSGTDGGGWFSDAGQRVYCPSKTTQKAIALAVINAKGKK